MAAPKLGQPGYKGPVHEAVRGAQETWDRTGGAAVGAAQTGVEGAASSLRGAGHSLFGPQTAVGGFLGGIFGGNQSAPEMPTARPAASPTPTARPLNVAAPRQSSMSAPLTMGAPTMSGGAAAKRTGGKANKRKKSKGK